MWELPLKAFKSLKIASEEVRFEQNFLKDGTQKQPSERLSRERRESF